MEQLEKYISLNAMKGLIIILEKQVTTLCYNVLQEYTSIQAQFTF